MDNPLGCNTLYPGGRLMDVRHQFTLAAHKRSLQILKEAGFEACEFSHFDVLVPQECRALREACEEFGLIPWSAHSWVTLPETPEEADKHARELRESVDAASDLGVKVVVVHAASGRLDLNDPEQRRVRSIGLETSLLGVAPHAIAYDIKLGIENCADRANLEFMVEVVRGLDLPNVGFVVDTGHAVLHGMDPAETIRIMGDRLCSTHLQDNFGHVDDHLPPGRGNIDWSSVIAALEDVGYEGVLMVEISDCPPNRAPDAIADTREAFEDLFHFARGRLPE
ncbi:MAG: sugar phosphate isomerase/epimerase [Kiritimatiellaeota bacterium]|nr:sugar phosphate isomerase/epimerase [Kiritimatiellota bacterium]